MFGAGNVRIENVPDACLIEPTDNIADFHGADVGTSGKPPSIGGGNPGVIAAPANMDAGGGENYGWDVQQKAAQQGGAGEHHAEVVLLYGR